MCIETALKDKYYLDKHFFPLKDKLLEMLNNEREYNQINNETKENIIYDILGSIKPRYNVKTKQCY